MLRVAVIGAGAAGLVALRHLTGNPQRFTVVAYELTNYVSGTWVYTDLIGTDQHGQAIHSSMYKNLRTNLPKEVMAFPDFPFNSELPSFISHSDVRQYLENYAGHFKLYPHIKFHTRVDSVSPCQTGEGQVWTVVTTNVLQPDSEPTIEVFDAVIVCNGHYAVPLIPQLAGIESFKGKIVHSRDYRIPDEFQDKTVAILGAAASGTDIALDIAAVAKQVYLLHDKQPLETALPDNISQVCGIQRVTSDQVILHDGKSLQVDIILFCTGYRYNFNFLSPECKLNIEDERVLPLYKHIIHAKFPTLSFVGVCKKVCPFPQFHCQVLFILATLSGKMVLPSRQDMDADIEKDFKWRTEELGFPKRYAHMMGSLQWTYNDELSELAGFKPIPKVVKSLYEAVSLIRIKDLCGYKTTNYILVSEEEYQEVSR